MNDRKMTRDLLEHHLVLPLYDPNGELIATIVENSLYDRAGNLTVRGISEDLINALIDAYPTGDEEDEESEEGEETEGEELIKSLLEQAGHWADSDDDSTLGPREFVNNHDETGEQEAPGI